MTRPVRSSVVAVLVVLAVGAAGWAARPLGDPVTSSVGEALSVLPEQTTSIGFTDWERLRSGPVPFDAMSERDLTTRSDLYEARDAMESALGWSVDDVQWEVVGLGAAGPVVVVRTAPGTTGAEVREGLAGAGFERRGEAWTLPPEVLSRAGLPSSMQSVRVLARERLVVLGETAQAASRVVGVVRAGDPAVTRDRGVLDVVQALAGSDAWYLERLGLACAASQMPDEESQQQADVALDGVGRLVEHTTSGRGIVDHGGGGIAAQTVTFAMDFAGSPRGPSVAREQLGVREAVSTGPFIGRSGDLGRTLRYDSGSVDGSTLRLVFDHDPDTDVVMTGVGPLLFASC